MNTESKEKIEVVKMVNNLNAPECQSVLYFLYGIEAAKNVLQFEKENKNIQTNDRRD